MTCRAAGCETAAQAVLKLRWLIGSKGMARPSRAIWMATANGGAPPPDTVAVIHVATDDVPMLRIRLTEMERGVTSLWTSIGFTRSPYVPPAERIRNFI